MTTPPERPNPRPRVLVNPDPQDGKDPVIPEAGGDQPRPAPATRRGRGPGTFAQLNTRVDPALTELVDYVASVRGWTKRDVVEHALKTAYKAEIRALASEKER